MMIGLAILGAFVGVVMFGACEIRVLRSQNFQIDAQIKIAREKALSRIVTV
jgi:hypothetical protein